VDPSASRPWKPTYPIHFEDHGHLEQSSYPIDDLEINECPRAIITPESDRLVQLFGSASAVAGETSATVYGPVLSEWPARMFDASLVIAGCESERLTAQAAKERERRH